MIIAQLNSARNGFRSSAKKILVSLGQRGIGSAFWRHLVTTAIARGGLRHV